jgi:hypothetical protein
MGGAIQGRVEWTPAAARMLTDKAYRFISPVFEFDRPAGAALDAQTGRVGRILRAALTNNPAMPQLPAIAASRMMRPAPLTENERMVIRNCGISEDAYRAQRAKGAGFAMASAPPSSSSSSERTRREIMTNCGVSEADFATAESYSRRRPGIEVVSRK